MLFSIALFSSLLLAPVVLAVPSGSSATTPRSLPWVNMRRNAVDAAGNTIYGDNWAGAMYTESNGTFNTVTGTFTVPTPSGEDTSSAGIWVGIDGGTCTSSAFQTGVTVTVGSNGTTVGAWCQFHPSDPQNFIDINISTGDLVRLTINTLSTTSGAATVDNLSNWESVSVILNSAAPLCGQNAEWIVEDYAVGSSLVLLANFGTVVFTNAEATGPTGKTYGPDGATILEIVQNNTVLTNVSTNETSVMIQYV